MTCIDWLAKNRRLDSLILVGWSMGSAAVIEVPFLGGESLPFFGSNLCFQIVYTYTYTYFLYVCLFIDVMYM